MVVAVLDVGDSLLVGGGGSCRRGRLDGGGVAMAMHGSGKKMSTRRERRLKMQLLNNPPFPR